MRFGKILALLALLMTPAHAQAPTVPATQAFEDFINSLPLATVPGSTDKFYVLQGGVSKQIPYSALVQALAAIVDSKIRIRLNAPLSLFADFVNGTDQPTCGLANLVSACKTLQYTYDSILVQNYDTHGFAVTINFNNTDTVGLNIISAWIGAGQVNIFGPGGSPPTIGINNSSGPAILINAPLPASLNLSGFRLQSGAAQDIAIFSAAVVVIGNSMNIGPVPAGIPQIHSAGPGSLVSCNGAGPYAAGITVSGGGYSHMTAALGGVIECAVITPTQVIGNPTFSGGFAVAFGAPLQYTGSIVGSATGPRFLAFGNGLIFTNGCVPNFFPGSTAGTTSSGGQCL